MAESNVLCHLIDHIDTYQLIGQNCHVTTKFVIYLMIWRLNGIGRVPPLTADRC